MDQFHHKGDVSYIEIFQFEQTNPYATTKPGLKLWPKLITSAEKSFSIYGDGSNTKSFLYCEDAASTSHAILHQGEVGARQTILVQTLRSSLWTLQRLSAKMFDLDIKTTTEFVANNPLHEKRYWRWFVNSIIAFLEKVSLFLQQS
ncbi:hypothetical protein M9H77_21384 [Catharanthus roseus]|uniref:Uncharacterized protein n=1 Tax=Catharanthus roseus TaxID=4058 RepID=A0ACC0AN78_CATRO|nr:hypothetical protein M9H77_21384 [Catharanthus roseus]